MTQFQWIFRRQKDQDHGQSPTVLRCNVYRVTAWQKNVEWIFTERYKKIYWYFVPSSLRKSDDKLFVYMDLKKHKHEAFGLGVIFVTEFRGEAEDTYVRRIYYSVQFNPSLPRDPKGMCGLRVQVIHSSSLWFAYILSWWTVTELISVRANLTRTLDRGEWIQFGRYTHAGTISRYTPQFIHPVESFANDFSN